MEKCIITVAPTGAWPKKDNNPNVPMTPAEIAEDVYACWNAGAVIAHLHMRDEAGNGTMDIEKFCETVARIREKQCGIIINCTTSGDLKATDETRMAHLIEIQPEMASYDCGSMNWMHTGVFLNPPAFLEKLGLVMQEKGVKPEIEAFDTSFIYNALHYQKRGILKGPLHFQFCLGAAGGSAATVENLVYLKSLIPQDSTWSAFGIGAGHMPILLAAVAMGGHVRVGMEDNVMYAKNRLAISNAEFVERATRIVKEANRTVATVEDARKILGLR